MNATTIIILLWVIFSTGYTIDGLIKSIKKKLKKPKEENQAVNVTSEVNQLSD